MASLSSSNQLKNNNNDNNVNNDNNNDNNNNNDVNNNSAIKTLFIDHQQNKTYNEWFQQMANELLKNYELCVNDKTYQIVEIEFYYKNENHHDTFVHCDKMQLNTCCQWYFHRQFGKSYKEGTYKGLDFTFGEEGKAHGGILIRSIVNNTNKNDKIIEGSCNVVNEMLSVCGCSTINQLVEKDNFYLDVFDANSILHVKKSDKENNNDNNINNNDNDSVVKCPRVGLTLKKWINIKCNLSCNHIDFILMPTL